MPTVKRQDYFLVSPEVKSVVRGQAQSFVLTVHKGYIGQKVNLNTVDNLEITITDSNGNTVKTASRQLKTLTVGSGDNYNQFQINLSGAETSNVAAGDLDLTAILTEAGGVGFQKRIEFTRLRLGKLSNQGDTLPDGSVPGRFVTPNVIYGIKSFNGNTDLPGYGELVLSSDSPSFVNRIIFNNTAENGLRNALLEQALIERFNNEGSRLDITLTNVNNPTEYATYKVISFTRVNISDVGAGNAEYGDGLQLAVQPLGNSRAEATDLKFTTDDVLGLTLDVYSNNSVIVNSTEAKEIVFVGGGSVSTDGDKVTIAIPILGDGGIINGVDGTSGIDGAAGADGADGTSGTSGKDGKDGDAGARGEAGTSGTSGRDGIKGDRGEAGSSGTSGVDGNDGINGDNGTSGTSGINGESGTSGTSGIDGEQGPSGPTGTSGTSGLDGADGARGEAGTSGTSGRDGISGAAGAQGEAGTSGTSGENGTSGVNGENGTSGTSGANGADGIDGTSGTSGIDGESGTSGTSGINGENGEHGTSGTSGIDGEHGTSGTSGIDGEHGTSGVNGENGTSGTSGRDGIDGVEGEAGTSGTSGENGTSGVNGENGTSGTSGKDGENGEHGTSGTSGENGTSGTSGENGTSGVNGENGTSGTSGRDGIDGENGEHGTSGTSGINGENGEHGTSGTSGIDGNDGNDGAPGVGINFKGNVPTQENLPEIAEDGDAYITEDTDSLWIWNGENWIDGGSIQGPAGTSGTSGVDGSKGDQGDSGTSGTSGVDGSKGDQGDAGTSGTSGIDGLNGAPGERGDAGTSGTSGTSGINGENGEHGTSGTSGINGENGTSGTSGIDGEHGTSGTSGADGTDGENGINGTSGTSGIDGEQGPQGETGAGGGNTYVARAEFGPTQDLETVFFSDFTGTGGHLVEGATVSTSGYNATFSFTGETEPPKSILVYAANIATNEYVITHLNAGGDNTNFKIKGITFQPADTGTGNDNQYDANIFSGFNTAATIDIDLQKANFDWNRAGFPAAKEAHLFVVFSF